MIVLPLYLGTTASASPTEGQAVYGATIVMLGLLLALAVLIIAMLVLVIMRMRRSLSTRPDTSAASETSAWAIAGQRADPDEDDPPTSVDLGGDADPNDDTWMGHPRS